MPALSAGAIKYRDLVLIECRVVRFRWNVELNRPLYQGAWETWRTRYDIVRVCRLCEGSNPEIPDASAEYVGLEL